jgi:mitogen-activated protein kinase kinase
MFPKAQGGDPISAISASGGSDAGKPEPDAPLPDLDEMANKKGAPLDVEDLDDLGWKAASAKQKIIELGSLGEGAGGAVTRCILKDAKTVFALKVCPLLPFLLNYSNLST